MPNSISKITFNIVDVKRYAQALHFFVSYDTTPDGVALIDTLAADTDALSNGALNGGMGIGFSPQTPGLAGANAVYSTIEDKAIMTFVDSAGNVHRWQIPCPKAAIFLADGMTVNPANALVVTWVDDMLNASDSLSFVCSRDGEQMSAFIGGNRIRRRTRRRVSKFIKDPTLTIPAE